MVLELDLEMTASSCEGVIITSRELDAAKESNLRSVLSRNVSFSAEVLINNYPIALDGILPRRENGVFRYNVSASTLTNRRWNSAMIPGNLMFVQPSVLQGRRSRQISNMASRVANSGIVPQSVVERFRGSGFETTSQSFEGREAITIEDELLGSVLAEFNRHLIVGTRIADIGLDPDLLDISRVTIDEDNGWKTTTVVHQYKGVGYQRNLFPTRVNIRKVGVWYFTRAEVVHRFDENGRQIDVYGRLASLRDRQNYERRKGEIE